MTSIVVGTTPTIKFTFSRVNPADIVNAVLTVKQYKNIVLRKDLTSVVMDNDSLSWTLTQQETLAIGEGKADIMLNWVDNNGIRGVSANNQIMFVANHINEVMTNE